MICPSLLVHPNSKKILKTRIEFIQNLEKICEITNIFDNVIISQNPPPPQTPSSLGKTQCVNGPLSELGMGVVNLGLASTWVAKLQEPRTISHKINGVTVLSPYNNTIGFRINPQYNVLNSASLRITGLFFLQHFYNIQLLVKL